MSHLPPRLVQAFFLVDFSSPGLKSIEASLTKFGPEFPKAETEIIAMKAIAKPSQVNSHTQSRRLLPKYSLIMNFLETLVKKLKTFFTEFPGVETNIITIETRARPINQSNIYCDLGGTLDIIDSKIKGTHRVEIFLFLRNEPKGWETRISQLRNNPNVRVTVFDFMPSNNSKKNLDGISLGWGDRDVVFKLEKGEKGNKTEKSFNVIRKCLKDDARTLRPQDFLAPHSNQSNNLTTKPTKKENLMSETNETVQNIPVKDQGVWQIIDPPTYLDDKDKIEHEDKKHLHAKEDWHLIGASRRGKMHAHNGSFREDAFALAAENNWHIMVVADGGGSCSLSRVGSKLAADIAVEVMTKKVVEANDFTRWSEEKLKQFCEETLQEGMKEAWYALDAESKNRNIAFKEFGTTFLALMHYSGENKHIVGVLQVGDGIVAAQYADGDVVVLADPDIGQSASVTLFLTSKEWNEWSNRVKVQTLKTAPQLLAAMCDGVSDDYIPYNQLLGKLFNDLEQKVINHPKPEEILLKALSYEKKGSFDDRTLTLIYHIEPDQTSKPSQALEQEEEALLDETQQS